MKIFGSSAQWPGAWCYSGQADRDNASKDFAILLYIQESLAKQGSENFYISCSAYLAHSAVLPPGGMGRFLTVNSPLL